MCRLSSSPSRSRSALRIGFAKLGSSAKMPCTKRTTICLGIAPPHRSPAANATAAGGQVKAGAAFRADEAPNRRSRAASVQPELAVDRADLRRLDQPRVRHRHRVQRALKLLQPEIEELVELRKCRAEIVVLPDISLQQPGVIGPPVEDVGGGQSVAFELFAKLL